MVPGGSGERAGGLRRGAVFAIHTVCAAQTEIGAVTTATAAATTTACASATAAATSNSGAAACAASMAGKKKSLLANCTGQSSDGVFSNNKSHSALSSVRESWSFAYITKYKVDSLDLGHMQ